MKKPYIKLVIPGNPVAKARPRFYRRGRFVGTYNSQVTDEGKAMLQIQQQYKEMLITEPVEVEIQAFFKRPNYHYGSGRNRLRLKSSAPPYCLKNKDVDNLAKFYLDCMNDVVWQDDSQVVRLTVEKAWAEDREPKTIIKIKLL